MSKAETKAKKGKTTSRQFQIKQENSKILRAVVETLSSIIDECDIVITPKEFTISAMDPSRICLLKLTMKDECFDEYKCNKKCKIGINLEDFDKVLKRCASNDAIELNFNEKDQKIKIKVTREGETRVRNFSLALLDIATEEVPMDNLLKIDYDAKWKFDPSFLIEALKDAEIYSEILNMKITEEELLFESTGQIGEMEYHLATEDLLDIDLEGEHNGSYSINFLKSILKLNSVTELLEISLKTDHPLNLNFTLAEGGLINYFLAPRVSEQEFDEEDEMFEEI